MWLRIFAASKARKLFRYTWRPRSGGSLRQSSCSASICAASCVVLAGALVLHRRCIRMGLMWIKDYKHTIPGEMLLVTISSLSSFEQNTDTIMQQLERLYRYNEHVDSSYLEPPVASSPSRWRDACSEHRCSSNATPGSDAPWKQSTSVEDSLIFLCSPCTSNPCSSEFIKTEFIKTNPDATFLSPRSPATRSCCSTPRKWS